MWLRFLEMTSCTRLHPVVKQEQKNATLKRMRERDAERIAAAEAEAKAIAALENGSSMQRAMKFSARRVPSAVTDIGRYERNIRKKRGTP